MQNATDQTQRIRVLVLVRDDLRGMVDEAGKGIADLYEAQSYTDFLAIPAEMAIVDPGLLTESDWNEISAFYTSFVDIEFKMVFVAPFPYRPKMPARNVFHLDSGLSAESLQRAMFRRAQPSKHREVWTKSERRVGRLVYMIHCLETGELSLRKVAERFEVSLRTVQRDVDILLASDLAILDGPKPGTYVFPKGYKAFEALDHKEALPVKPGTAKAAGCSKDVSHREEG